MSTEHDGIYEVARLQRARRLAAEAQKRLTDERKARLRDAFEQTGIPQMFDQLGHLHVPHYNAARTDSVPLRDMVDDDRNTHTALWLRNGMAWGVTESEKGAITWWFRDMKANGSDFTPDKARRHFLEHMATLLPNLEDQVKETTLHD